MSDEHQRLLAEVILILAMFAVGLYGILQLKNPSPQDSTQDHAVVNFEKSGVITESLAVNNSAFKFVYDLPGSPAATVELSITNDTDCKFGEVTVKCATISSPLIDRLQGVRVHVSGERQGEIVSVGTLTVTPAEDTYGIVRTAEKNGVNALVTIDTVRFLSGEDAIQAVMKDTGCERSKVDECVPSMNNDFYIQKTAENGVIYNMTPGTVITLFKNPGSPELETVSLDQFLERARRKESFIIGGLVKVRAENATITEFSQVYTP